tara:strand:- start:293 stop:550 length:258 start_codon:yes stop_codon:yes gene_type:complete
MHKKNRRSSPYKYKLGKRASHATVIPNDHQPIERAIKKFMRKVKKSGVQEQFKKHEYYEKPSEKRKRAARKRCRVLEKLKAKSDA